MKKAIILLLIILIICITTILSGLSGRSSEVEGTFDNDLSQFVLVEKVGNGYYIVADKNNNYEYYATYISTRTRYSYVIGGNVLDEDGHPKKYLANKE